MTGKSEILKKEVHGKLPHFFKLRDPVSSLKKIGSLVHHLQCSLSEEQKKREEWSARKGHNGLLVGGRRRTSASLESSLAVAVVMSAPMMMVTLQM